MSDQHFLQGQVVIPACISKWQLQCMSRKPQLLSLTAEAPPRVSISLSSPSQSKHAQGKHSGSQLKRPAGSAITDLGDTDGSRMHAKRMCVGASELVRKMKSAQQAQGHEVGFSPFLSVSSRKWAPLEAAH